MKKLLIVPIVVLVASAFGPMAQAHHPGAQGPDLAEGEEHCYVLFHAHASCTVTNPDPPRSAGALLHAQGVPTADGWHNEMRAAIIDNDTSTLTRDWTQETTVPFTEDWLGVGVPLPSPSFGMASISVNPTSDKSTNSTCLAEVTVGNGAVLQCYINQGGAGQLPPGVPLPV